MNTGYSTFTGRSQAGRGKNPWGITSTMAKRIQAARAVPEISVKTHTENLFTFTGIFIQHARGLAKAGQKDAARNWYRFFNNAQIVPLLSELKCYGDVAKLREDLNFLGLECHPLDVPSFETDLQAIRHCLNEILSHVSQTSRKIKKPVNRSSTGRNIHRHHGASEHVG